ASLAEGPGGTAIVGGSSDSIDFPTTPGAYQPLYQGLTDGYVACLSSDGTQLVWSTVLGGAADHVVGSVAVDSHGAVVVGGDTKSNDFPTIAGSFDTAFGAPRDGFLARLSAQGDALEWSSFVGGNKSEFLYAIALAPNDEVAAVGSTQGGT